MRIVIAGASTLGTVAARKFIEGGHDVVVIDQDRATLEDLSDRLDCGLVEGDATLPSTLREAGGEEPGALLALTNSDEDNILCAVVARSVGYERVVPQILKPELCAICDELELNEFITPNETVAATLVDRIERVPPSESDAHLSGELRLTSHEVAGRIAGRKPGDLDLGSDARLVVVRRNGEERFADDTGSLEKGDTLIVVGRRTSLEEVGKRLTEADSEPEEDAGD